MDCPNCHTPKLKQKEIEPGLNSYFCSSCEGLWLRGEDYFAWNDETSKKYNPPTNVEDTNVSLPVIDSKSAKLCPSCQRILTKYKAHSELGFYLEHCNTCRSMWFDRNEWENMKQKNLEHQVHLIATKKWQKDINLAATKAHFETKYIEQFGEENYQKLCEIRSLLKDHPAGKNMLSFLSDDDPYVP